MKTTTQNDDRAFVENGNIWEGWMSFDGITCNEAFDAGYDSGGARCEYTHPALQQAFASGVKQYHEENN